MTFEKLNLSRALFCLTLVAGVHILASAAPPQLRVVGNHLENSKGQTVRLQGVNIPSLEWDPKGDHFFQSLDAAMNSWNAKVIRVPLTQDLWFGYYQGKRNPDGGKTYRETIDTVIKRISSKNGYMVLDLHWSDGGVWNQKVGQHCMPDANSTAFWKEVAKRYANNPAVLYDLYNEPHDVSWSIWRDGGQVEEKNDDPSRGLKLSYKTPGMQSLVNTVRATGAKNIIIAGGLDWAFDLRGINEGFALKDKSGHGIMYATHLYPWKKDWTSKVTPIIAKFPVFVGEVGTKPWKAGDPPHENVYTPTWAPEVISYITKSNLNWTAWSFHPGANPCIIKGWDYSPTEYWGKYVKAALARGVNPKRK